MAVDVVFLDVGQGDCTILYFYDRKGTAASDFGSFYPKDWKPPKKNGSLVVVDAGSTKSKSTVRPNVEDVVDYYAKAAGGKIDWLVLTHPDTDHYNMVPDVLKKCAKVDNVIYSGSLTEYKRRGTDLTKFLTDMETAKKANPALPLDSSMNAPLVLNEFGHKLWLLSMNSSGTIGTRSRTSHSVNTDSVVLLLGTDPGKKGRNYKIFLMGDATEDTELSIIADTALSGSGILSRDYLTLLKMGHHGSTSSTSKKWVEAITPDGVLASSDTRGFGVGGTGMPSRTHLDNIETWAKWTKPGPMAAHKYAFFDDTPAVKDFSVASTQQVLCTTLIEKRTTKVGGRKIPEWVGGNWFWRLAWSDDKYVQIWRS